MERQIPKNVRQIGNVSGDTKVYIEDYVDTFLNQLCDKADETPIGAFLVGEKLEQQGYECIYIHGSVSMRETKVEENNIIIDDEIWKAACEDCKNYFGESVILGWFMAMTGQPMRVTDSVRETHEKWFPNENSIYMIKDTLDKEEQLYFYKYDDLMELGGHYIYYEKNPSMQNYMISTRRKIGVPPSEAFEDRAAKDFRSMIQEKLEQNEQKQANKMTYVTSTFLILVVLVIGVTTINNYDRMQSVQDTLENISDSVMGEGGQSEVVQVNDTLGEEGQSGDGLAGFGAGDEEHTVPVGGIASEANGPNPDGLGSGDIYVVQQGDTLAGISQRIFGDISKVDEIHRLNGLNDGDFIYIGQELLLP